MITVKRARRTDCLSRDRGPGMAFARWRKPLIRSALTALVASVMLTAAPAQAAAPVVPSGPVKMVNHAYTTYLVADNATGAAGTFLQVYYSAADANERTFTFEQVNGPAGVFKWRYVEGGNCAEPAGRGQAGANVLLQKCSSSKTQWWVVRQVDGTENQFVISPYNDEGLALTARDGNDNYAPLRELPGNNSATASQRWHLVRQ